MRGRVSLGFWGLVCLLGVGCGSDDTSTAPRAAPDGGGGRGVRDGAAESGRPPSDGGKAGFDAGRAPHDASGEASVHQDAAGGREGGESIDGAPPESGVVDPRDSGASSEGGNGDSGALPRDGGSGGSSSDGGARFEASTPLSVLPTLSSSDPPDGATDVPKTAWIRLDFASDVVPAATSRVSLECDSGTPSIDVDLFEKRTLVVNSRSVLPDGTACAVHFTTAQGDQRIAFTVASAGAPAIVPYDRNDTSLLAPFPDAFYMVDDATTRTGRRVDVRVPTVDVSLQGLLAPIISDTEKLDGMSPLAPIVVVLPASLDPTTVPRNAAASLDPFASLALFDVDPASGNRDERVPFDALLRDEQSIAGDIEHVLVVFPSVPLSPRGHYAFVVTGRALVNPSRPLEASPFFQAVAGGAAATLDELRTAGVLLPLLDELSRTSPPLRTDDVALALGLDVRSVDDIPDDLLAVRADVAAAPAPAFSVTSAVADAPGSDVAAIVTGTWSPLNFSSDKKFIARDAAGRPTDVGTVTIPFTLAIPKSATTTPAPLVFYQHGQPGNSETEVPNEARNGLAKAGFAVIGFTDYANREIIPDGDVVSLNVQALATLVTDGDLPDYLSLLTHADQLSFLRALPTLGSIDVLPLGAPDKQGDLDVAAPLSYFGISQGSIHGTGLVAFAPEIHAAALTVGAGRFSATLVHQASEQLYQGIGGVFPTITRAEFYAGLSLVQMGFDRQDPQNLARFYRRQPLSLGTSSRASLLLAEGLGDTLVPYYSTRSGAFALGVPHLLPHAEDVPFLGSVAGPVHGNLDASTTAAFFQYVPENYALSSSTPGCIAANETEGHYCAQIASEAIAQRATFFTSALGGAPIVVNPLP